MFVDIFKGYLSSNIFIKRKESQQAPEIVIFNAYEGDGLWVILQKNNYISINMLFFSKLISNDHKNNEVHVLILIEGVY